MRKATTSTSISRKHRASKKTSKPVAPTSSAGDIHWRHESHEYWGFVAVGICLMALLFVFSFEGFAGFTHGKKSRVAGESNAAAITEQPAAEVRR